jgi:hypothetical protein
MPTFRHFVAYGFCQYTSAVLGDRRTDFAPLFFDFHRLGNDDFSNHVSWHMAGPFVGSHDIQ